MVRKRGEIDLRIEGKLYLVRNVAFEQCLYCGEKVISPNVSQIVYDKIKNGEYTEEAINIPVLYGTDVKEGHEANI